MWLAAFPRGYTNSYTRAAARRTGHANSSGIKKIAPLPKAQKYHSGKEFHDLFSTGFQDVRAGYWGSHVRCLCRNPYPIDAEKLRAALEFEFDLPYPDGQRMGLANEAIQAFSQRLSISL